MSFILVINTFNKRINQALCVVIRCLYITTIRLKIQGFVVSFYHIYLLYSCITVHWIFQSARRRKEKLTDGGHVPPPWVNPNAMTSRYSATECKTFNKTTRPCVILIFPSCITYRSRGKVSCYTARNYRSTVNQTQLEPNRAYAFNGVGLRFVNTTLRPS